MTRDDEFEPILRPWMHRRAPDAPNGLVLRIIEEIEMSEQAPSESRLSRFASWPAAAWAAAATAVAAVAVVAALLIVNLSGTPGVGDQPSPSPTASPSPVATQAPSDPQAVVDGVVAAWNAGGGKAAAGLYVGSPAIRFTIDSGDFTSSYSDIEVAAAAWGGGGSTLARTGAVALQGPYAAFPLTWTSADGAGNGIGVLRITADGLVAEQFVIGATGSATGGAGPAPGNVVAMVDAEMAAESAADGAAAAQYFAQDAELRWIKYANLVFNPSIGQSAIVDFISTEEDGRTWTRTADPIAQGAFVVYPIDYQKPGGSTGDDGFEILELNADGTIQLLWAIGYPY